MNYDEAMDYIHNSLKFGIKLGLENMNALMGMMDNVHKKLRYVHIAGTNGKGSTAAFLSEILIKAKYNVGTFTSPYLERFSERIKVNGEEIQNNDIARITGYVRKHAEKLEKSGLGNPTEFEIVTAIAFQYFYEKNCDIVVLEVGLGGRLDSTNIIDSPLLSIITAIDYDHMDILGETLPQIAYEKAGIIKKNGEVLIYPQSPEVEKVIRETCENLNANLTIADFDDVEIVENSLEGQKFNFRDYKDLRISMLGKTQIRNSLMALLACEILNRNGLNVTRSEISDGLADTKWPGRFEVIGKKPFFIIDGAHNPNGVCSFIENLGTYFPEKKSIYIIGVMKDKNYVKILEMLAPTAKRFITVTPNNERSLSASELAETADIYCKDTIISGTINEAVETAQKIAKDDDIISALGSLYYTGEIRKIMLKKV